MLQILQRYHAGFQVDGPPQVTVETRSTKLTFTSQTTEFNPIALSLGVYLLSFSINEALPSSGQVSSSSPMLIVGESYPILTSMYIDFFNI